MDLIVQDEHLTMDRSHTSATSSMTAYHSFNDVELYEPASPPRRKQSPSSRDSTKSSSSSSSPRRTNKRQSAASRRSSQDDYPPAAPQMKRQDSGYESHVSTPRASISHPNAPRPAAPRRTSTSNVQGHMSSSSVSKIRGRPSTRRSMKPHSPHNGQAQPQVQSPASLYLVRTLPSQRPVSLPEPTTLEMSSYVQFPSPPDPTDVEHADFMGPHWHNSTTQEPQHQHPPPPQTTHYWTSDRTRRLEYAAIDAASRGVKGWIRRNLLPDCFVARDDGHIAFDDDTGSVRRYRLELEDDVPATPGMSSGAEKALSSMSVVPRRRTWQFWSSGN